MQVNKHFNCELPWFGEASLCSFLGMGRDKQDRPDKRCPLASNPRSDQMPLQLPRVPQITLRTTARGISKTVSIFLIVASYDRQGVDTPVPQSWPGS